MTAHGRNTNGHDRHIVLTAREIGRVHQAFAEDVRRQQRSEVFRQVRAADLSGQSVRVRSSRLVCSSLRVGSAGTTLRPSILPTPTRL